jgi:hypothetical protein
MSVCCSGVVNDPFLEYSNAVNSLLANSKNRAILR